MPPLRSGSHGKGVRPMWLPRSGHKAHTGHAIRPAGVRVCADTFAANPASSKRGLVALITRGHRTWTGEALT